MRKDEVLDLAWDRVDFSRGVIRLELTKSGKRREVAMRQVVHNVLPVLPGAHAGRVWPATILGQADIKMTTKYAHLSPSHQGAAMLNTERPRP